MLISRPEPAAAPAARVDRIATSLPVGWPVAAATAALVVGLSLQGGAYGIGTRSIFGIALWWAIGLTLAVGIWPVARIPRPAAVGAGVLTVFAGLSGISGVWANSAEDAFVEMGRALIYVGVFVAVVFASRAASGARWSDGLAVGIVAVGLIGLMSRLLPGLGAQSAASTFFGGGRTFLSYPLEYWNALAVLVALAFPLLLRPAVGARSPVVRGLALAPLPALAGAIYLTSSRGGVLTALIGIALFIVLCGRIARATAAAVVAGAGSALAVVVLASHDVLTEGPIGGAENAAAGRPAALLILLLCVAVGFSWSALSRKEVRLPDAGRRLRRAIAALGALLLVAGAVAAKPVERFDSFREAPVNRVEAADDPTTYTTTTEHLLSSSGNGRWQFWSAAVDQFADSPVAGHGAGSYEAWWAQNGSISYFTRQAHSLYLETMGELGLLGLSLLVALLAIVLVVTAGRLRTAAPEHRLTVAALGAAGSAFAVAAGIDWLWEMTVVGAVGIALVALLVGPATQHTSEGDRITPAKRVGACVAAVAAVVVLALPWLADRETRSSRQAALDGNAAAALDAAASAEKLTPWAASPRLQRALVLEGTGDSDGARAAIAAAIERESEDWRLWLVRARIERAAGDLEGSRLSLERAETLNPRSPIFAEDDS